MSERSGAMMDILLGIHREREPRAVLRFLLRQLEGELGRAILCCYLPDAAEGQFRGELVAEAAGDVSWILSRAEVSAPLIVQAGTAYPPIARLADSALPVHVTDQVPAMLIDLWGKRPAEAAWEALGVQFAAVAPIIALHGPIGVMLLLAVDAWPVDAAAEYAAHAAVALANLCERTGGRHQIDHDAVTGLYTPDFMKQAVDRELNRAERYRRMASLAAIDLPEAERTPDKMRALAALVNRVVRLPDMVGLLGPGRIAVLMPETPAGGAAIFANRLKDAAGPDLATLRAACAMYPQDGRTWEKMVEVAITRLDAPPLPRVPNSLLRGGLRAAFPDFRMGRDTFVRPDPGR